MFVEEKREGEVKPITPPLEPWQQSCLEAANYLATCGWQQAEYGGRIWGEPACLIGALRRYEPGVEEGTHPLYERLSIELEDVVEDWNDAPERTAEEVIQFLEIAALK